MCSGIGGEPLPKASDVTDADGKAIIVADVKKSFEYCGTVMETLDGPGWPSRCLGSIEREPT
jgi:hypothetical protein